MALFLTVFAVCMLIFGGMVVILLLSHTPRYRTEPEHLLNLFDKALENRVGETEWNAVIGYPIRHDEYLESVRRRARYLMDEHGRHGRVARGKPLLDADGQAELAALRDHLAARTRLRRDREGE
ncbi:hypothetical protein [Halomonas caseinilytica]|uniref:Uncharacterized protein n=1 Tax=Halomonas caseinilytica TaxID=438744 RepID=A0A1M6YB89_9GAMM|nr:hypothetical protein [Halomonas caseinilytica]SEN63239.1 hypothetical protein SAMN04487952_12228 [Halomonas caseinilytica]SHL15554.1 hypothetical protein SAMN05192556_108122 [Halomonas caseinilytica]